MKNRRVFEDSKGEGEGSKEMKEGRCVRDKKGG